MSESEWPLTSDSRSLHVFTVQIYQTSEGTFTLISIVYSFIFTKWLSETFMMKTLAAERCRHRECEALYKQCRWCKTHRCARQIKLRIFRLAATQNHLGSLTAHKWRCNVRRIRNDRLLLHLFLILHSEDVWRSCGTDAFPSYDRREAYATRETQTNSSKLDVVEMWHSSDSKLNPLSLLLQP